MTLPPIPPFYTGLPTLTPDNWRAKAAEKRGFRDALIPVDWILSSEFLGGKSKDVRSVVSRCGILTERELEITEMDELQEVRLAFPLSSSAD